MVQKSSLFEEAGEFKAEKLVNKSFTSQIEATEEFNNNLCVIVQTSEEIALYAIQDGLTEAGRIKILLSKKDLLQQGYVF